jgi:uncharacterized membrane protein
MEKFLAFCAFALTVGYAQAQTTAGHMMIGGNVGYTSQTFESINGDTKQKTSISDHSLVTLLPTTLSLDLL